MITFVRSFLYRLWLYGGMITAATLYFPFALFSPRAAMAAARLWAKSALFGLEFLCGGKVRFEGLENLPKDRPFLLAAKHQAMLDIFAPVLLLDYPAIVLKKELLSMPGFGWFAQRAGMIAIDREANASALRAMLRAARTRVAEGRPIVIFPEGTRQELGAPPDYKPGVAALYRDLQLDCVPVALNTGLIWPANGMTRRSGQAVIRFLPPIPAGLSREDFMQRLQTAIETHSAALLAPAPSAA